MDIVLTNSLMLVPKDSQDIFIKLCNIILSLNIPVKDLIFVINLVTTNAQIYMLIDKIINKETITDELLMDLRINIFKEVRSSISLETFQECGYLLHPLIERYCQLVVRNRMIRKMLLKRHRCISQRAKEIKVEQPLLNDFDIWLLAEKEVMTDPRMYSRMYSKNTLT